MKLGKIAFLIVAALCISTSAFAEDMPAWVKKIRISGDVGIRTEFITDEKSISDDAHYDRLRFRGRMRLGVDTNPVDKVKVGFGLETSPRADGSDGTADPTSAWVTFTDFNNASVRLSHAYIQYSPSDVLTISGGKIKNDAHLWKPVQLVWKNDVNPFGVAMNINVDVTREISFFANAALLPLTANRQMYNNLPASDTPMHTIVLAQPGAEYKPGKNISVKGAFAVQQFSLSGRRTNAVNWITADRSFTLLNPAWEITFSNLVSKYGVTFKRVLFIYRRASSTVVNNRTILWL